MARRKKEEGHVNHERWLVSYADFITLLFAFFTSMYAISTVDAEKAGKMVFSTRAAFSLNLFPSDKPVLGESSPKAPPTPLPEEKILQQIKLPERQRAESRRRRETNPTHVRALARELEAYITRQRLRDDVLVRLERRGLIVSLAAAALFEPGDVEMRKSSLSMVDAIAERLLETGHHVRVEGHTDVARGSNWKLSAARAVSVVTYLAEELAYPADRLSVAGFASHRPVADNQTDAGRRLNRRVDFVLEYEPEAVERESPSTGMH